MNNLHWELRHYYGAAPYGIIPRNDGGHHGIENIVRACKSCNSSKGTKTMDEFRFMRAMQQFQRREGVWFTQEQVTYLKGIGVELDIPVDTFWFELAML